MFSLVVKQSPQLRMSFKVDVVAEERPVHAVPAPLLPALQQAARWHTQHTQSVISLHTRKRGQRSQKSHSGVDNLYVDY